MSDRCVSATKFMDMIKPSDGATPGQLEELKKMREMATYNNLCRFEAARIKAIEALVDLVGVETPEKEKNTARTRLDAANLILTHSTDYEKLKELAPKIEELQHQIKMDKAKG